MNKTVNHIAENEDQSVAKLPIYNNVCSSHIYAMYICSMHADDMKNLSSGMKNLSVSKGKVYSQIP